MTWAWQPLPAAQPTAAAPALDDGSDGWFAGAQRCFVGAVIAGAAAALATSVAIAGTFNRDASDSFVAPASTVGDAASSTLPTARAAADTKLLRWWQTDDVVPQPATIVVDDSPPRFVYVQPNIQIQGPEWDDQALLWRVDEAYGWEAWKPAPAQVPQPFSDTDDPPPSAKEDDAWQPAQPLPPPAFLPSLAADADFVAPAPAPAFEDDSWSLTPRAAAPFWWQPWAEGDDVERVGIDEAYEWAAWSLDPRPLARLWYGDDERVTAPPPEETSGSGAIQHAPVRVVQWHQDDILPTAAAAAMLEDDGWAAPPRAPTPAFVPPWADGDEVESIGVDDADPPPFAYPATTAAFCPVLWFDDDILPTAAAGGPVDDEPWLPLLRNQDSATFVLWATTEEIVPQPSGGSEGGSGAIRHEPVRVLQWHQDDVLPTAVAGEIAAEDYWPPSPPQAPAPIVQLWHQQDEAPRFSPLEEDAPLLLRNQDSATFVLWATTEEIVPQPRITEDYWQEPFSVRVPPVRLLWEQQDERPEPPPPLEIDSDYWLTFPVPPSPVIIAMPVDEEFPTLSAPPPPPPVVAPESPGKGYKKSKGEKEREARGLREREELDFILALLASGAFDE